MGTRHYQTVIDKAGVTKVAQYGQWDGYPSGQGLDILSFLRTADLEKYQQELSIIREATEAELSTIEKMNDWVYAFPYLSRDCGAKIHELIIAGDVPIVRLMDKKEAYQWCEGFYTIDFSKGVFISEYDQTKVEYPLASLPTDKEYLKKFDSE